MKKIYFLVLLIFIGCTAAFANPGDTTWVQAQNLSIGASPINIDTALIFPNNSKTYRKIYMIFTLGETACPSGSTYCHQWDYTVQNYLMTATDTFELSRFITPFATGGFTARFSSTWTQPYVFDITDFYPYLQNTQYFRIHYSGYSGGFTANVKFAFIEGVPDRNVVAIKQLYDGYFSYGDATNPINTHVPAVSLTAPTGTISTALRTIVTGHGSDSVNECCEFDEHSLQVMLNGTALTTQNIWNSTCTMNELYPQGGTWPINRSNWCPGDLINPTYNTLPNIVAGSNFNTNIQFSAYTAYVSGSGFGGYQTSGAVVYYGGINKTLDASLQDIVAPSSYTWHFRENPSNALPSVTIHNSGSTSITSLLLQYGVLDSVAQQYTWSGTLAPLADTTITLPALTTLTNLSQSSANGTYQFVAQILKVNGQVDNDQTNDTLKSNFIVAPNWPGNIVINMRTGNIGANGNLSSNPWQGSWTITDMNNNVISSEAQAKCSTTYNDTVALPNVGFYKLTINSAICYGLHWWAIEQSGITQGALIVKNTSGTNIPMNGYTYAGATINDGGSHDDFGCSYTQYFYVSTPGTTAIVNPNAPTYGVLVYPNPATDKINVEVSGTILNAAHITLVNAIGQTVYSTDSRNQNITIPTQSFTNGIYTLIYDTGNSKNVQKVVISK